MRKQCQKYCRCCVCMKCIDKNSDVLTHVNTKPETKRALRFIRSFSESLGTNLWGNSKFRRHQTRYLCIKRFRRASTPPLATLSDDEFRISDPEENYYETTNSEKILAKSGEVLSCVATAKKGAHLSLKSTSSNSSFLSDSKHSKMLSSPNRKFAHGKRSNKSSSVPPEYQFFPKKAKVPPNACVTSVNAKWEEESKEWREKRDRLFAIQLSRAYENTESGISPPTFLKKTISEPPKSILKSSQIPIMSDSTQK